MAGIETKFVTVDNVEKDVLEAADIIRAGGLVAFPTETVYGLGANALDVQAVKKIFIAKGRPNDNPLIIHINDWVMLEKLVTRVPATAQKLARHFWPGPLTLVLPKAEGISREVTAGLSTVAVRMPQHPVALALIKQAGVPIAAPSANTSGRPSPTRAEHVIEDLRGKVDMILDGGQVGVGVESTVLDLTGDYPLVLRPGGVTLRELSEVLQQPVMVDPALENTKQSDLAPKSPGMKYTHYAPKAPLVVYCGREADMSRAIMAKAAELSGQGLRVGIMCAAETAICYEGLLVRVVGERRSLETVAANLYAVLRQFDTLPVDCILAEGYPLEGIGLAIMNRLEKAAGHNVITL